MDTPVLAVRHVSKSFAGVRALVDIDLEIAPGEIHCLAGENGSGKSTLALLLAGATPGAGTRTGGGMLGQVGGTALVGQRSELLVLGQVNDCLYLAGPAVLKVKYAFGTPGKEVKEYFNEFA